MENEVATTAEVEEPSTLPSDLASEQEIKSKLNFDLTDDLRSKYVTKDGKLLGKYETLDQLAEAHKFLQDKHAMYVDDTKKQEKEINGSIQQEQNREKQQDVIMSLLPDFMSNNMELTPEMEAKVTESGIDIRDLKIGAMELKDKVSHVHELVGGKENWDATKEYLSTRMSESDYEKINKDLVSSNSDYTVLGMYNSYKESLSGNEPKTRISGDTATRTSKGYESRTELFKDREYLNTQSGRKDTNAQKRYRDKLTITDLGTLGIKA